MEYVGWILAFILLVICIVLVLRGGKIGIAPLFVFNSVTYNCDTKTVQGLIVGSAPYPTRIYAHVWTGDINAMPAIATSVSHPGTPGSFSISHPNWPNSGLIHVKVWGAHTFAAKDHPCSSGSGSDVGAADSATESLFEAAPKTYRVEVQQQAGNSEAVRSLTNTLLRFDRDTSFKQPTWIQDGGSNSCRLDFRTIGKMTIAILSCRSTADPKTTLCWASEGWDFQGENQLQYIGDNGLSNLKVHPG